MSQSRDHKSFISSFWVSLLRITPELTWVILGQTLAALGAIVGVRVLTNVLVPTVYGEIGLGMTVVMLTQQVLYGPLCSATIRCFASAAETNTLAAFFKACHLLFLSATAALGAILVLLTTALLCTGHSVWIPLLSVAGLLAAITGYNSMLDGLQTAARQRAVVALHQGVGQWFRYGLAFLVTSSLLASSTAAMFGYAIAASVTLGSQTIFFYLGTGHNSKARGNPQHDQVQDALSTMWAYGKPFALYGVFTWAQGMSDRWALQLFRSTSDVGLYQIVYQLGYYPMTLASGMLVQFATPILFARAGDGKDTARVHRTRGTINKIVACLATVTVVATAAMALLDRQIFSLLVAPEYRAGAPLASVMVLAAGMFSCAQVAVLSLLSSGQSSALIAPKVVTAIFGTAINCVGARMWGVQGVVWSVAIFSAAYLIWVLYLANRRDTRTFAATDALRQGSSPFVQ